MSTGGSTVRGAADLPGVRREYAKKLGELSGVTSEPLLRAFATVPREKFLGDGPWKIYRLGGADRYEDSPDADPRHLYENVLVGIDPARRLNNGEPASLCGWLGRLGLAPGKSFLHIGAGVGYYTAIAAEAVGASGRVLAVEVDAGLAARAKENLSDRPNTRVIAGDGSGDLGGPFDAIFVNAGATHVPARWVEALMKGGVMLLPLTVDVPSIQAGVGYLLEIVREPRGFAARFASPIAVYHCHGARTDAESDRLKRAYDDGGREDVCRLRTDAHDEVPSCWLHLPGACLSTEAA